MWCFVTILLAWLLADFVTGIVHWAQDKLLNSVSRLQFLNQIKADNDLHHAKPAAMTQLSAWQNINTSVPFTLPISLLLFWAGVPTIIWLAVLFASFANLVHRFAHIPKRRVHVTIRFMQRTGLFISADHHNVHHFDQDGVIEKQNTTVRYCPMTCWLNPALDLVGFFPFLEYISRRLFGS